MLQYDVARMMIDDLQAAAARGRADAGPRSRSLPRRPVRRFIGRRLVHIGLRLASAQG